MVVCWSVLVVLWVVVKCNWIFDVVIVVVWWMLFVDIWDDWICIEDWGFVVVLVLFCVGIGWVVLWWFEIWSEESLNGSSCMCCWCCCCEIKKLYGYELCGFFCEYCGWWVVCGCNVC